MFISVSKKRLVDELRLSPDDAETVRFIWSKATRQQVLELGEKYKASTYHGFVNDWGYYRALVAANYLYSKNEFHGLEYIGENKRTGFDVYYLNAGDTYATTLIFHNGVMRISTVGDLVERGIIAGE